MEGLKEAFKYLMEEQATPSMTEVNGETYCDKKLYRVNYNPKAEMIEMSTLSSLVDYIRSGVDFIGDAIVHIQSPTQVEMYSALDMDRIREHIVRVKAQIPEFRFNNFIDHETFCINVQSKFINDPNTDRAIMLKFAGTVEHGTVAEYGDDGVTQKATVKNGISSKVDGVVPNPVTLRPYRTFLEVEQPASEYVFRMKQGGCDGIQCALFEADGGAWKNEAMNNIKGYLKEQLKDVEGLIVIS